MLRQTQDGITLAVRAQPGAKKTTIIGVYGDGPGAQLKIAVNAPPLEGRANQALTIFLAKFFAIPRGAVTLVSGASSRSKVFLLQSISLTQAQTAIQAALNR